MASSSGSWKLMRPEAGVSSGISIFITCAAQRDIRPCSLASYLGSMRSPTISTAPPPSWNLVQPEAGVSSGIYITCGTSTRWAAAVTPDHARHPAIWAGPESQHEDMLY